MRPARIERAMENAMTIMARALSVAMMAVLLSGLQAYGQEVGSTEESHAIVVNVQNPASETAWYEITVLSGVPQQVAAFDSAGDQVAVQVNPGVGSGPSDEWCILLGQAVTICDACGDVVLNSGCGR
jgi:hypothetical protein